MASLPLLILFQDDRVVQPKFKKLAYQKKDRNTIFKNHNILLKTELNLKN